MAYTYEQVYTRASGQQWPYFTIIDFNDELVTYEYYSPVHNQDGQIMRSPDGDSWSQLVNIDHNQADVSAQNYYDGHSLAVYKENLWISQYSDARILEQLLYKWDHSKKVICKILIQKYKDLQESGWVFSKEEVKRDIDYIFKDSYLNFIKKKR